MFKTYPKPFNGGTINGNVDVEGVLTIGGIAFEDLLQNNLNRIALPINVNDSPIPPINNLTCADDNFIYIYSNARNKWGRIAIDKSNW